MNVFDEMAYRYDTEERIEIANIMANEIKSRLKGFEEKTAIDLGCGTGLVGLKLINYFKSIEFIDTSKNMIDIVNEKIEKLNIKNASAYHMDILVDDTKSIKVDCIFMSQVLLHIPEYKLFLKRVYNMLNSNGVLIIVDFDKNEKVISDKVHNGFDTLELGEFLESIDFKNISSNTFYSGREIFMKQDASMFILEATKGIELV